MLLLEDKSEPLVVHPAGRVEPLCSGSYCHPESIRPDTNHRESLPYDDDSPLEGDNDVPHSVVTTRPTPARGLDL